MLAPTYSCALRTQTRVLSGPIPTDRAIRRVAARLAQRAVERQFGTMTPGVRRFLIGAMAVYVAFQLGDFALGKPVSPNNFFTAVLFAAAAVHWWLYPPTARSTSTTTGRAGYRGHWSAAGAAIGFRPRCRPLSGLARRHLLPTAGMTMSSAAGRTSTWIAPRPTTGFRRRSNRHPPRPRETARPL